MIHAHLTKVQMYYEFLKERMPYYKINTPLRRAHFLAQLAHESGELRYSEDIASGIAYENRADLGNTERGDGQHFKGRGLIQLTGRANYQAYSDARGKDFTLIETSVFLASNPYSAVDASCWFWDDHDLNVIADNDDILKITRKINGGTNGLDDRKAKLARAKFFLMR
jgi:putative chitinase